MKYKLYVSFAHTQSKCSVTKDSRMGWWFRRQKSWLVCGAYLQEKRAALKEGELSRLCGIRLRRACGLLAFRYVSQIRVMFHVGINRSHLLPYQWNCAIFVMLLKLQKAMALWVLNNREKMNFTKRKGNWIIIYNGVSLKATAEEILDCQGSEKYNLCGNCVETVK